jgi:hypothetical protein
MGVVLAAVVVRQGEVAAAVANTTMAGCEPSVSVMGASFSINDESSDLSPWLRKDLFS